MSQVVERLAALGITLPKPAAPVANYVGAQKSGALLFVSGQLPLGADGKLAPDYVGKLGPASTVRLAPPQRGYARSTCWLRRRRRSAISTASSGSCGSAAFSPSTAASTRCRRR